MVHRQKRPNWSDISKIDLYIPLYGFSPSGPCRSLPHRGAILAFELFEDRLRDPNLADNLEFGAESRLLQSVERPVTLLALDVRTELRAQPTEIIGVRDRSDAPIPACVDGAEHRTSNRRPGRDHDSPWSIRRGRLGGRALHPVGRQDVLKHTVDVEPHNFHYHLDELVDVELVDRRQPRTADSQGFNTYYRPTAMGRGIFDHGFEELMRREASSTTPTRSVFVPYCDRPIAAPFLTPKSVSRMHIPE